MRNFLPSKIHSGQLQNTKFMSVKRCKGVQDISMKNQMRWFDRKLCLKKKNTQISVKHTLIKCKMNFQNVWARILTALVFYCVRTNGDGNLKNNSHTDKESVSNCDNVIRKLK